MLNLAWIHTILVSPKELQIFINYCRVIRGLSLEPLYSQLPDELRGYVKFYYDVANLPHFRFIE